VTSSLVTLDSVTCRYGAEPVLVDVSLDVREGSFVGIVGPSGAGKSTVLRAVTGAVAPVVGAVRRRPDLRVGYVPQVETVNWDFPVTVRDVVLMARFRGRWQPWSSRSERAAADAVLDRLGLGGLGDRHIRQLSGGQQQRVFVARALMSDPQLVLLDEPTSGVDVRTRHEVLHLLGDLHRQGIAIVLSTHDLNGIAAHLPELVCLNRRVIGHGAPREVLTAEVLEATYGARMEVLEHAGLPVVVDHHDTTANVVPLRRSVS
jgi:ABC-type Mn2+/Zn2+ transport system ATPase subunit